MTSTTYSRLLVAATILLAVGAVARWQQLPPRADVRMPAVAPLPRVTRVIHADSLAAAAAAMIENDPFRLAIAPSQVRYDPALEESGMAGAFHPPPAPRPMLTLKAIVGGPPWQAVIDGLPGQPPATVVREGSTFDKLVVQSVTRERVVVKGMDTVWTLAFRSTP